MGGFDFAGLFEAIQEMVEKRWGKFWSWVIYFGLVMAMVGLAIWLLRIW